MGTAVHSTGGIGGKVHVSRVMTRAVHTGTPNTPPELLARVMHENQVSALPILDRDGRVVGMVSDDEPEVRCSPEGTLAAVPIVTVHPETSISDAARIMLEGNLRHLLVVDARGRLEGILSRSDLHRRLRESD